MTNMPVRQLSQHVYWMPPAPPDRPSLCAVSGSKRTLILDAGSSAAHIRAFRRALALLDLRPLRYAALSHWHWDHVFGASELSVPLIAHVLTTQRLSYMESWEWTDAALDARVASGDEIAFCADNIKLELPEPRRVQIVLPDLSFVDMIDVDLGSLTAQIQHVGGDHAADSCIAYVPADGVLFLSDCLYDAIYAPTRHYTREKLYPLLDRLLEYDARLYVEGHSDTLMHRSDFVELTKRMRLAGDLVAELREEAAVLRAIREHTGVDADDNMLYFVRGFIAGSAAQP